MTHINQETKNTFFNFRLEKIEMERLRKAAREFGYISFAEFIRAAIRELIQREKERKNAIQ
ncbi:MAG: ribbon-helix-helix protein, CopG family [Bacteroidetes bacterium]|nr:ribbon-helix-helix protein, CopG family [Bacteroidota bacterium]